MLRGVEGLGLDRGDLARNVPEAVTRTARVGERSG